MVLELRGSKNDLNWRRIMTKGRLRRISDRLYRTLILPPLALIAIIVSVGTYIWYGGDDDDTF